MAFRLVRVFVSSLFLGGLGSVAVQGFSLALHAMYLAVAAGAATGLLMVAREVALRPMEVLVPEPATDGNLAIDYDRLPGGVEVHTYEGPDGSLRTKVSGGEFGAGSSWPAESRDDARWNHELAIGAAVDGKDALYQVLGRGSLQRRRDFDTAGYEVMDEAVMAKRAAVARAEKEKALIAEAAMLGRMVAKTAAQGAMWHAEKARAQQRQVLAKLSALQGRPPSMAVTSVPVVDLGGPAAPESVPVMPCWTCGGHGSVSGGHLNTSLQQVGGGLVCPDCKRRRGA